MKVIDARPAGVNSIEFGKSSDTKKKVLPEAKFSNWFENMFKTSTSDRCAINNCNLYNKGCKSKYTGGKVGVTNAVDKTTNTVAISFSAMTNVPAGYS